MRESGYLAANYGLFLLVALALSTLQVTFWFLSFGHFPPPHFWLPVLVYWSLYRRSTRGIAMIYLLSLSLTNLTGMPLGLLLIANLILFVGSKLLKSRFYWAGPTYFMLVCGVAAAALPILHFVLSWAVEDNPMVDFGVFDWLMRTLWTALVALPLYQLFSWFDELTYKQPRVETGVDLI